MSRTIVAVMYKLSCLYYPSKSAIQVGSHEDIADNVIICFYACLLDVLCFKKILILNIYLRMNKCKFNEYLYFLVYFQVSNPKYFLYLSIFKDDDPFNL